MNGVFWLPAQAFLITFVLTPILRDISRSYNLVDRPGVRKVHSYPVPRVGGVPIALAYVLALVAFSDYDRQVTNYDSPVWKLLPGMAITFLVGLVDDLYNLPPLVKLGGQIAAAVVVFQGGLRIETLAYIPLPLWLSAGLTIFWLLLVSNALNLIDGLDGLCGGMAFFAVLTIFLAALVRSDFPLIHATLPLAGALLGFLFFNFHPATVFLGDSGALTLGFLIGCFGLLWNQSTTTYVGLAVPLLAVVVPLLDVSLSVARRWLRGSRIFGADRGHIHHRLLDRGFPVRQAVAVLYGAALLVVVFAALISLPDLGDWRWLVGAIFAAGLWAGIRELRYAEFDVALKLLGGEFRRTVAAQARLAYLKSALERAPDAEAWWNALAAAAREAGWIRVEWNGPAAREVVFHTRPPQWRLTVEAGAGDRILLEGDGEATPGTDLVALTSILQNSLVTKRREWEQPALS
jgi:UDP-GlcNAc:undecaprenyl-phosphate GlcNAc-1-phosphate transferase